MEILDLGNNESLKQGVYPNHDGTWTAMTFSKSQSFKTPGGAQRWFKRNSDTQQENGISDGEVSMETFNEWGQLNILTGGAKEWANRFAADHDEGLLLNGEHDLHKLANKCIADLFAGRNVTDVISEWNAMASLVGFGMMWKKGNYTSSFAIGILEDQKKSLFI